MLGECIDNALSVHMIAEITSKNFDTVGEIIEDRCSNYISVLDKEVTEKVLIDKMSEYFQDVD